MKTFVAVIIVVIHLLGTLSDARDSVDDPVCRKPPRLRGSSGSDSSLRRRFAPASPATQGAELTLQQLAATYSPDAPNISRTDGGCTTRDGLECDQCCNGKCCEVVESMFEKIPPGSQMWIPLRFILVQSRAPSAPPAITQQQLDAQVVALNRVFSTADIRMHFFIDSVSSYSNPEYIANCNTDPCYVTEDCYFYKFMLPQVSHDPSTVINIVVCDLPYLGEAQWPWATDESDARQYIQVSQRALPGRDSGSLGMTLVHEMGHYFSLMHTFERSNLCDEEGDYVDDTPSSSRAAVRSAPCGYAIDSCPSEPGGDPVTNYMNYAADACMDQFTPLQIDRMLRAASKYRPVLQARYLVEGYCPSTALNLTQCTCSNTSLDPLHYCGGVGGVAGFVRYTASPGEDPRSVAAHPLSGISAWALLAGAMTAAMSILLA